MSLMLSLTPQQQLFLTKVQLSSLPSAPLYIPGDFKTTLTPTQQSLYALSQIWKLPRSLYLSDPRNLDSLVTPPIANLSLRQQQLSDHRLLRLMQ